MATPYLINRDISWLYFNHRVLQEAMDEQVPLYERIKFLAIYSSNLDEFFRVRVASLRSFKALEKEERRELLEDKVKPKKILKQIKEIVQAQQSQLGRTFREEILPQLEAAGIFLVANEAYTLEEQEYAKSFFKTHLASKITWESLEKKNGVPFLKNKTLYFIVNFIGIHPPVVLPIPSEEIDRFVVFPNTKQGVHRITFLDDIIRSNLPTLFPEKEIEGIYSIKISRDADLHLADEFEGDLIEQITRSLAKRNIGVPARFLYDKNMPEALLDFLQAVLQIQDEELVRGARYHNFNDFFGFPDPTQNPSLHDEPMPPMHHPQLESAVSILALMKQQDVVLHFPYQSYEYIPRLIWEAAEDEKVETIRITLYRVAAKSNVTKALIHAVQQGKRVIVFIEAKARFDEESNLYWGNELKKAGAKVLYSFPGVKVHTKLLLITKEEEGQLRFYSYIGTGNFNEKTAKLYGDHALLTNDTKLGKEIRQVFYLLERRILIPKTKDLLISPFTTRSKFEKMIKREIKNAGKGEVAYIVAKMNSLEDMEMIEHLVEASQAGVKIKLIVRGICRLVPGIEGYTENIEIISILDRFLEHARVYIFCNGGKEKMYISSADWMTRNLDRRVEVAVPVKDEAVFGELRTIINIQLADNVKARLIRKEQDNPYKGHVPNAEKVRAQTAIYNYLKQKSEAPQ